MLRQAKNEVKIEGILSEIKLKEGQAENKNINQTDDYIAGSIVVKVDQIINKEQCHLEIPVQVFAYKTTKQLKLNPSYASIKKIIDEGVSIAASDEEHADRVRITKATIDMNDYPDKVTGQLRSYPRIRASFINKIDKSECNPEATFETELVVLDKNYETAADGTETGRYKIQTGLVQYGGKVDLVPFFIVDEKAIAAISQYWDVKDTVQANGKLNFCSKTEHIVTEVDFGEPIEKVHTVKSSELIITGGTQTPLDGAFAYDFDEIQQGLVERKARLEKQKEDNLAKAKNTKAPSQSFDRNDLGF